MNSRDRQLYPSGFNRRGEEASLNLLRREQAIAMRNFFREHSGAGRLHAVDPVVTANLYVWQYVDFGTKGPEAGRESARGYLMVEPEDIPLSTAIIGNVYERRRGAGSPGRFKWLLSKLSQPGELPIVATELRSDIYNDAIAGDYKGLRPVDPRVVMYENSPEAIQEILADIASLDDWLPIEERRRAAFDGTPPVRGDDYFTDQFGKPWHSLSYNRNRGHSRRKTLSV